MVNPAAAAGRGAMRLGATIARFRNLGEVVELYRPPSASKAAMRLRALAGVAERVVVVGGDGMVHNAANALAGSTTVLGIISAGTGNDAATALGVSDELEAACLQALGEPTAIDLIETPAGLGVTVATAGFSVAVNERADGMRFPKGGAKYTLASLAELPKLESHHLTMTIDGSVHEIEANLIAIANTAYFGGGMKIAPDADPTDGLLDVVVIGPAPRAAFAALLPTVFLGRHVKSRYVTMHRGTHIGLAGESLNLRADGEQLGTLPATITVRPASLLVAGIS